MIQHNPTTEATATTGWPGYTPEDLAWFAANYADTEWAVHVIGPDDVHVNEPDAQGEHNPDGKPLTEQTAWALADQVRKFNAWYRAKFGEKPGYTEDLIPNVFHRGVLVETRPEPTDQPSGQQEIPTPRPFRVGDLVEITGRGDIFDGKTGVVAKVDDDPQYPMGLTVAGFVGLVWCNSSEIRRLDAQALPAAGASAACGDCDGTGVRQVADPIDLEFQAEEPCEPCDGTGRALPDLATLTMSKPTVRPLDACLIRFQRRGTEVWADFFDADGDATGTTVHPGDRTVAELIAHYGERGWAVVESAHAADGGAR